MTRRACAVACVLAGALAACGGSEVNGGSALKTDLRDNQTVRAAVEAWRAGDDHCEPRDESRRAIVMGFTPFERDQPNISGIAAMSMADPDFFPSQIALADAPAPTTAPWAHAALIVRGGGYATQRTLVIDGLSYDVCFLYVDVVWDLAAAIVLEEVRRFDPQAVILSGTGTADDALFEAGATNRAKGSLGNLPFNVPTVNGRLDDRTTVLPDLPQDATLELTWDPAGLVEATKDLLPKGFSAGVGEIRKYNEYICNNISLVVQRNLSGYAVSLAGGQVEIAGQESRAKVGFLHYPAAAASPEAAASTEAVFAWTKVLAKTVVFTVGE